MALASTSSSVWGLHRSLRGLLAGCRCQFSGREGARLVSGSQAVQLEVVNIYAGRFRIKQAILKPKGLLTAGKTYRLKVDGSGAFTCEEEAEFAVRFALVSPCGEEIPFAGDPIAFARPL